MSNEIGRKKNKSMYDQIDKGNGIKVSNIFERVH